MRGCFKRMHVAGVAMGHICVDVTVGELPVEVVAVPFWSSTKLINLWSFSISIRFHIKLTFALRTSFTQKKE